MISVIVPVYNVEPGIGRCIESVMDQSYSDWELILVDDGSPDRSGTICDEYAEKDSRIKVFHKKNEGVSSARNLGIEQAKGEWVVFIDGDDVITTDYLSLVVKHNTHDIIVFGMATDRYTPDGKLYYSTSALLPTTYINTCDKLTEDYTCILKSINMESSCCKAYRKEIIDEHNLRFNTDMICFEDFDFVLRYLMMCKGTFCSLPYIAYHYIQEISYNSIQRRNNRDLSPSIFILLQHLTEWSNLDCLSCLDQDTYFYIFADKYRLLLNQVKGFSSKDGKRILDELEHNLLYQCYKEEINIHGGLFFRLVMKLQGMGLSHFAYFLLKKRR